MSDLYAGIKANNFVVVGRAGIDFFTDAGVAAEDADRVSVGLGGSAAVTRVSDDSVGSYCTGQLKRYGVATDHVTPVGGEFRNSLAFYESRVEGHRNVIYRNGAADFQMDEADVARVDYTGFGALITAGTVLQVAEEVLSKAASLSDMIVGNDEEFGFIAGGFDKGLAKARELSRSTPLIVYKMGEAGAITFAGGQEIQTGIYPVQALKPTGAGDSFMAGLLTALADGYDLKTSLLRGSACASVTVSRPGCAPAMPDPKTLEEFLQNHPGPTELQQGS